VRSEWRRSVRLAERGAQVVIDVTHVQPSPPTAWGNPRPSPRVASQHGGCVVLCGATRVQRWLLRKTRLAEVVSIHDDVASARRYLAALRPATVPDDPAR